MGATTVNSEPVPSGQGALKAPGGVVFREGFPLAKKPVWDSGQAGLASVKLHPDFLQQKPAAVFLDHTAVNVQHDAVVEVGSVTVSKDFAKPDIFPTSFLVVLANPVLDPSVPTWLRHLPRPQLLTFQGAER